MLSAKVTNIVDGDTIVVAWTNNQNQIPLAVNQIRLEGIDAPDHNQAFGDALRSISATWCCQRK